MANEPQKSIARKIFSYSYDIITATISLSDLATDLMVLVNFYEKEEKVFFISSLIIIILAQFAYCVAFTVKYHREHDMVKSFGLILLLLPVAPVISFLFYFLESYENSSFELCGIFELTFYKYQASTTKSLLKQWMDEKLSKHLGFILEAACEAFPQSILQMIAIVYFKEANLLSIISIIISMFSVASKSFVFAVAGAMDTKTLVFNWLCAVTDFFGIFFAVSWVFYNSNSVDDNNNTFEFNFIGTFWFIKYACCVLPIVFFGSIGGWGLGLSVVKSHYIEENTPKWEKRTIYFFGCIVIFILWVFGIVTSSILLEIAGFIYVAFCIHGKTIKRYPSEKIFIDFYNELLDWCIYDAKEIYLPNNVENVIDWQYLLDTLATNSNNSNNNDNGESNNNNNNSASDRIKTEVHVATENRMKKQHDGPIVTMKRQLSGSKTYSQLDEENEKEIEKIEIASKVNMVTSNSNSSLNSPSEMSTEMMSDKNENDSLLRTAGTDTKTKTKMKIERKTDESNETENDEKENNVVVNEKDVLKDYCLTNEYIESDRNRNDCGSLCGINKGNIVLTKQQDRLLKICCVNTLLQCGDLVSEWNKDEVQAKYLIENTRNAFRDVTFQGLRLNTNAPDSTTIVRGVWTWYSGIYLSEKSNYNYWLEQEKKGRLTDRQETSKMEAYYAMRFSFVFFYVFGPIYLFSRILNFLFPFIILIYVSIYDLWFEIDLFQWSMMFTYTLCVIIVLILLIVVLYHQYYLFHIIGSLNYLPCFNVGSNSKHDWHMGRRKEILKKLNLATPEIVNQAISKPIAYDVKACCDASRALAINKRLEEMRIKKRIEFLEKDKRYSGPMTDRFIKPDKDDQEYIILKNKLIKDLFIEFDRWIESCQKYYNLLLNYKISEICIKKMFNGDIGRIIWQYCDDSLWIDEINLALMATYIHHQKGWDTIFYALSYNETQLKVSGMPSIDEKAKERFEKSKQNIKDKLMTPLAQSCDDEKERESKEQETENDSKEKQFI